MDFFPKKLPPEAAPDLRRVSIQDVRPYALLSGPAYVFLKANGKFLGVKGPFDFFTPEDLKRFEAYESFYFTSFLDRVAPFEAMGRQTRVTLDPEVRPVKDSGLNVALPPAPFEVSDAIVHLVGPLWGVGGVIEPFFAAVFANNVCEAVPEAELVAARERDVATLEQGVLHAGLAAFFALHLGYCRLDYLSALYRRVFQRVALGAVVSPAVRWTREELDLLDLCARLVPVSQVQGGAVRLAVVGQDLRDHAKSGPGALIAARILHRLQRIESEFVQGVMEAPSIHTEGGFAHGG